MSVSSEASPAGPELSAVRCRSCGGTVRLAAGRSVPACLFCGADAADLVPSAPPEGIQPPEGAIPFATREPEAQAAFEKFARSSFWYPSALRSARLEVRPLLLPAWAWSGEIETHWTGLVSASGPSGKAPLAGHDAARFDQILVPASKTLRLQELASLGPYDETSLAPFTGAGEAAVELSELTRSAARARAHDEMLARHRKAITSHHALVSIRASSLVTQLDGRPVLVPVWIGAYRYGRRTFRVLVNGQTGLLVGEAPISWWKVGAVVALIVGIVVGLGLALVACLGGGSALGVLGALVLGR